MSEPLALRLHDVGFAWPRGPRVLDGTSVEVGAGERVLLTAPSGAGKSTLLGLVCGTLTAETGRVEVLGQDVASLSGPARDRFRAERLGVVFQQFNLLPHLSVADNIRLPLAFAPARQARVADAEAEIARLLEALRLPTEITRRPAGALSVGQQQRVAVARALIGSPDLIVADEPTSALDANARASFLELLNAQVTASGASLLMVSHDEGLSRWFDRSVALDRPAQEAA